MNHLLISTVLAALLLAPLARADEAEDKLEKRIENKVLADHQVTKAAAAKGGGKGAKAILESKADRHDNSVRGSSGHGGGKPMKTPPKRPPEKKKPTPPPPPHHH